MGVLFTLQALCEGNPPVAGGFPHKWPIIQTLMFSFLLTWTSCWTSSRVASDLNHLDSHVMSLKIQEYGKNCCGIFCVRNKFYISYHISLDKIDPDSKVYGANMGPTWVLLAPDGLHIGPMNLAIRGVLIESPWKLVPWVQYGSVSPLHICISLTHIWVTGV